MRWRMVDRVQNWEEWRSITGAKVVSFEEGALLGWAGREGEYPLTMLVQCGAELASWLAAISSGFSRMCLLDGVEDFRQQRVAEVGDCLEMSIEVVSQREEAWRVWCRLATCGAVIAEGTLRLALVPLNQYQDAESEAALWREIYAPA